jgi:hypothetical protein
MVVPSDVISFLTFARIVGTVEVRTTWRVVVVLTRMAEAAAGASAASVSLAWGLGGRSWSSEWKGCWRGK